MYIVGLITLDYTFCEPHIGQYFVSTCVDNILCDVQIEQLEIARIVVHIVHFKMFVVHNKTGHISIAEIVLYKSYVCL